MPKGSHPDKGLGISPLGTIRAGPSNAAGSGDVSPLELNSSRSPSMLVQNIIEWRSYDESKVPNELKDWIDGEHPFAVKENTYSVGLYKPRYTVEILKHALCYTHRQLLKARKDVGDRKRIARGDFKNARVMVTKAVGETLFTGAPRMPFNTLTEFWWTNEHALFDMNVEVTGDGEKLRRTIAALCAEIQWTRDNDKVLIRAITIDEDMVGFLPWPLEPDARARLPTLRRDRDERNVVALPLSAATTSKKPLEGWAQTLF